MSYIFNARIVFAEGTTMNDRLGPVSVGDNGWVTLWRSDSQDHAEAMYPPHAVLIVSGWIRDLDAAKEFAAEYARQADPPYDEVYIVERIVGESVRVWTLPTSEQTGKDPEA